MSLALAQPAAAPRSGVLRNLALAIGPAVAVIVAGEAIWVSMIAAYSHSPTPFPWFIPAMAVVLAAGLFAFWIACWSTVSGGVGFYIAYRMQNGLGAEVPMTLPNGPHWAVVAGLAMAAV